LKYEFVVVAVWVWVTVWVMYVVIICGKISDEILLALSGRDTYILRRCADTRHRIVNCRGRGRDRNRKTLASRRYDGGSRVGCEACRFGNCAHGAFCRYSAASPGRRNATV
jgi:hypothetical protein